MKIAIHYSKWGFSSDWITYCEAKHLSYKIVNCYASDIIEQIADCDVLMWHHHHTIAKSTLFAKQLLFSVQQAGKKVFPDFNTGWHFDDKVGQKYLLEAIEAPFALSYIFYSRKEALNWISQTTWPKVLKLRGGAGSSNVQLVRSKVKAYCLARKAFRSGFPTYNKIEDFKENIRRYNQGKVNIVEVLKSIRRLVISTEYARIHGREKGYIYFQNYISGNNFDIRIITIGERAFGIKRLVRKNDFRASGSGSIIYVKEEIDERCVKIAFETTEKLKAQCVAYDFVFDTEQNPFIVEINYGFDHKAYFPCPGYWDRQLKWHINSFNSAEWIVELLIR